NANAHSDGEHPVVQMYLWDLASGGPTVTVNSPASVAGTITFVGQGIAAGSKDFSITSDLVMYNDKTASTGGNGHNACGVDGPSNGAALSGHVCVVDQGGGCTSGTKAHNCFLAGATGMLMVFVDDNLGNILGSADPSLASFGALSITQTDGAPIEAAMQSGTVNATLARHLPSRDGSVDGTIMSHEWGHIMSNRLIGDGNGLFNAQGA